MGIIEFGRAFMIANVITHAARDGARIAAELPSTQRTATGTIADPTAIRSRVMAQLVNVMDTSAISRVDVVQAATAGIPTVTVTITGDVPFLLNLPGVGHSFGIARSATFRDEGR